MFCKRHKPRSGLASHRGRVSVHLYICFDERSHQPRPDRALVISGVSGTLVARVSTHVLRISRREGTQAEWSQQFALDRGDYFLRALRRENGMMEADGKD